MESVQKEGLLARIGECITQLRQAEKALHKEELAHSAIYVGNVQDQLPKIRQQLVRENNGIILR